LHQIRKTRYCLTHENQYFKIDVYPFWNDRALMEIELRDEKETVCFPGQVEIIKEVTDDGNYNSRSLAQNGGRIPEA
jgi:CYTH domain-containing protein